MITSWNADAIVNRIRQAALRGAMAGIAIVEQKAVDFIVSGEKTGKIYRRRGVVHQASAPGEPPASDTGRLVGSRETTLDAVNLGAKLAFHTDYAWRLEAGTLNMEPRPFARRALFESQAEVRVAYVREIQAELSA